MAQPENKISSAGDINIIEVVLISRTGNEYDIKNLVSEINIYEDMFASCLSGSVVVSDGMDLINEVPIVGEELIRIRLNTPTFSDDDEIYKTFKIYAVTDKIAAASDRSQVYTIHFISQEGYIDSLLQINGTFNGNVSDVVSTLFDKYLKMPRNTLDSGVESRNDTELLILDSTRNTIAFNSPSWSPFKCINYVASRSLREDNDGSNFLFYETNKNFVYGSMQELIDMQMKEKFIFEQYIYAPANVQLPDSSNGYIYKKPSLDRSYKLVQEFTSDSDFNLINSNAVGHLANRVVTYDIINKHMNVVDYDYVAEWSKYKHVDKNSVVSNGVPIVSERQLRSNASYIMAQPIHEHLFSGKKDDTNTQIAKILTSRMSLLADASARKVSILVAGRTDIECGMLIEFLLPAFKSKELITDDEEAYDAFYSGIYLTTAIRHKITPSKHVMRMELSKSSTPNRSDEQKVEKKAN